ncbi:sigma-70 family RNA polymerase sigma factor [Rhizobium sp. S152]|uniref:RNA polymerase sigma factor n=1 Tax=Rhizobium sp. S152 TaxID=3055038 RepID=UPI0025A93699|nr:sigma-70 family RNA polymerase sigma factor [Rhizobium sp. S152]MDM9627802.1 sigma-70 family RNA polymerase sigma factor [Rhizobium sp. S152]
MTEDRGDRLTLVSAGSAADAERARHTDLDWAILMGRAQNGDSAAYFRLLQEVTPYLRSIAIRYHRDQRDVEDTVQDILLTVHSIRETYDPTRPFGPWLLGIANRRAIDRLRRQGRQRAREYPLSREHDAVTTPENIEEVANKIQLHGAIDSLPPSQRQAIEMLKLKEMSLKDASEETGISISSLKVATHRALRSLRRILLDRGGR